MSSPDPVSKEGAAGPMLESAAHFGDVRLEVTIELGRRLMRVREILELRQNSIVEFPKSAGESVDVYVNGRLIGFGEVVHLDGEAGVRLTDFVVPH